MWLLALLACVEPTAPSVSVEPLVQDIPDVDVGLELDVTPRSEHPVCAAFFEAARPDTSWTWPATDGVCVPADQPPELAERGLPMLSFTRELAGLTPLDTAPGLEAQACALAMHAHGGISHYPSTDWTCWSEDVADVAATSLLATVPVDESVVAFLVDPENEAHLGHRRWLLSDWLDTIWVGSTDTYTCLELGVREVVGEPERSWIAWPPPGTVPSELLSVYGYHVDREGWSVQSDLIDLSTAEVVVSTGGVEYPVEARQLQPNMGSRWAISFTLENVPVAGAYHVEILGVDEPIAYDVELVDCGLP